MLSPKNKRILLQIIPFGLISLVFSMVYNILEKGILGDHPTYPSTGNPYSFKLVAPAIISFVVGLFIGVFEVLYLSKKFQNRSLGQKIVFKTLIYLVIITLTMSVIVILSNAIELGVGPLSKEVLDQFVVFLSDFAFWSVLLYFTLAIILCLFYHEISENIGQAVLLNFFTGKYHEPKEEDRVYMFLDMKSSTTFAEQLGHVQYFKMLTEYYEDLSNSIIQYGGEIYQYVGDEVVITWKLNQGFANNCLNCFFAMKEVLSAKARKYQSKYGVIPTFKAGIHYGKVTTGEIGVIKKEIIFSGDVLITSARIQGLCNTYNVDLLTSEKFIDSLEPNTTFAPKVLGEAELRGKNEKINLYTIEKTEKPHTLSDRD